jgi:hypothetical protein
LDGTVVRMQRGMKEIVLAATAQEVEVAVNAIAVQGKSATEDLRLIRERFLGSKAGR